MHEQGIRELLKSSPYSTMSDAEVVADLTQSMSVVSSVPVWVTSRTLYAELDPEVAEAILQKLEAAKAVSPVVARVLTWMQPSESGIDVTNAHTISHMGELVTQNILSQQEVDEILVLGLVSKSRGELLGVLGHGEMVTEGLISALR